MKYLYLLLITVFLTSCDGNPFSSDPTNAQENPYPSDTSSDRIRDEEREPAKDPADALSMIVDGEYEFTEGIYQEIKIKAEVPSPWGVDMEVEGLPAGATFDAESLVIGWKPGYFDGNELGDPSVKVQIYPITIWLRSTDPESEVRTAAVSLIVYDSPLALNIDGADSVTVEEGDELSYSFEIENEDYPQGPFSVNLVDFPGNVKVETVGSSTTEYKLTFNPDFEYAKIHEFVKCPGYYGKKRCLTYEGKIRVINPANHMTEKEVVLYVKDVRQDAKLVTPEETTQGLDTSFQVAAFDMNGEMAPEIKLSGPAPIYGNFSTKLVPDESTNSSVLNVTWTDIPPSYSGQTYTFEFMACNYDYDKDPDNCVYGKNKITIQVKERKAPVITRSSWPAGHIEYFNYDTEGDYEIEVVDGDNTDIEITNVEVMPDEYKRYVSFRNGVLNVDLHEPGIHQFSIVATSAYNVSTAESFVAEVYDEKRSKTLYFTDSTRTEEVKFYRDTMGTVEIMNPALQALNERTLSGRETLIIGTNILLDDKLKSDIEYAMDKIKNVVVATPLIRNMPQSFIDELEQDFHVPMIGRYDTIQNAAPISQMQFIAGTKFEQAKDKVTLKLNSSSESANPMIFSLGVDRIDCVDAFDLTDSQKLSRYKVGIICDRPFGGRYVLFGTEFSDIKVSEEDKGLPEKWFNTMLTTSLNINAQDPANDSNAAEE